MTIWFDEPGTLLIGVPLIAWILASRQNDDVV
jgi:hypothetical protein